jgi:23S rRNA (cytosine1962-C5)-methyltransferase
MPLTDHYELLDFGAARKLERFGPYLLDRPSPAAGSAERQRPKLWSQAAARYESGDDRAGRWTCAQPLDDAWTIACEPLELELKLTDSGQLGVFPEQAANWQWIADQVRRAVAAGAPPKVLNLFAYTGASTLAAAAAGAQVVHVDAAAGIVDWARRNARHSGLAERPIRWIVEDAAKFVRRELARGNRYDAVILDPPAYGHGPKGESWQLDRDLDALVDGCLELCGGREQFLLLSCHSGPLGRADELRDYLTKRAPHLAESGTLENGQMWLETATGRRLHAGAAVRFRSSR